MSRVYADNVYPELVTEDLTLGASGDSVVVTSGASLNVNTLKDSGGNTIFTSNGSGVLSSVNSAFSSKPILLTTETASSDVSLSFTSDIDSTYKVYIFSFFNIHASTDDANFSFQANAVGESGYNETMLTTFADAYHGASGTNANIEYNSTYDQVSGTDFQVLSFDMGIENDENTSGTLYIFNPSSTVYSTQFYCRTQTNNKDDYIVDAFSSGYFTTTSALDEFQFKMSTGNIDAGTIKMYGL